MFEKERETLTSNPSKQNESHIYGAYSYLNAVGLCPRYGIIAAHITYAGCKYILDIGCGIGQLRRYMSNDIIYHGIDKSKYAIDVCKSKYSNLQNTKFDCCDIYTFDCSNGYDCVVLAGLGYGYGRSQEAIKQDWELLISKSNTLCSAAGILVIESIVQYSEEVNKIILPYRVIAKCIFKSLDTTVHPERMLWVVAAQ